MARASLEDRIRAVLLYIEGAKDAKEISSMLGVSLRTIWRWIRSYRAGGPQALARKKPGPESGTNSIPEALEERIVYLKQKHLSWGARRIKYQYGLPCHWRTVHRVIKRRGMLVRIKPKPQPSKRFQRKHVDSMWQGDSFQFRISSVGKVYVTGFIDDRSRFRVASGVYLHKIAKEAVDALRLALARKRIPREIYLDNTKQFIAKEFKTEAKKHGIKLIFGKPYHPRGRGKIERYHEVLWQELITQKRFSSLSHFKRELRRFDRQYNYWRKSQALGWKTPAEIYNDKRYFGKKRSKRRVRQ
ncbi:MAG: DDE-type integrase/transposase/recombinase [archaeon]|nr:DDE-type integrase/transposase/recombinase [archaeon]